MRTLTRTLGEAVLVSKFHPRTMQINHGELYAVLSYVVPSHLETWPRGGAKRRPAVVEGEVGGDVNCRVCECLLERICAESTLCASCGQFIVAGVISA